MNRIVWGLDIGGTKTALCAADETGKVLARLQTATGEYPDWESLLSYLIGWGREHLPLPCAVGVSCGGPLDPHKGVIQSPPNLPGWDDVPVTDWLTRRLGVPAFLQNDANACALAEWMFGAGHGTSNMVFITFGTGFGAGLILDGRLYEGTNGNAGEIGHMRLAPNGPVGYGKAGSVEGFCSGGGLRQLSEMRIGKAMTAKELVEAADAGDAGAISVLNESAEKLGFSLSVLIDLINPERIVIGSIFARSERWFRSVMQQVIDREALPASRSVCTVVPAQLGDSIGDIAAVTVAFNGLKASEEKKA